MQDEFEQEYCFHCQESCSYNQRRVPCQKCRTFGFQYINTSCVCKDPNIPEKDIPYDYRPKAKKTVRICSKNVICCISRERFNSGYTSNLSWSSDSDICTCPRTSTRNNHRFYSRNTPRAIDATSWFVDSTIQTDQYYKDEEISVPYEPEFQSIYFNENMKPTNVNNPNHNVVLVEEMLPMVINSILENEIQKNARVNQDEKYVTTWELSYGKNQNIGKIIPKTAGPEIKLNFHVSRRASDSEESNNVTNKRRNKRHRNRKAKSESDKRSFTKEENSVECQCVPEIGYKSNDDENADLEYVGKSLADINKCIVQLEQTVTKKVKEQRKQAMGKEDDQCIEEDEEIPENVIKSLGDIGKSMTTLGKSIENKEREIVLRDESVETGKSITLIGKSMVCLGKSLTKLKKKDRRLSKIAKSMAFLGKSLLKMGNQQDLKEKDEKFTNAMTVIGKSIGSLSKTFAKMSKIQKPQLFTSSLENTMQILQKSVKIINNNCSEPINTDKEKDEDDLQETSSVTESSSSVSLSHVDKESKKCYCNFYSCTGNDNPPIPCTYFAICPNNKSEIQKRIIKESQVEGKHFNLELHNSDDDIYSRVHNTPTEISIGGNESENSFSSTIIKISVNKNKSKKKRSSGHDTDDTNLKKINDDNQSKIKEQLIKTDPNCEETNTNKIENFKEHIDVEASNDEKKYSENNVEAEKRSFGEHDANDTNHKKINDDYQSKIKEQLIKTDPNCEETNTNKKENFKEHGNTFIDILEASNDEKKNIENKVEVETDAQKNKIPTEVLKNETHPNAINSKKSIVESHDLEPKHSKDPNAKTIECCDLANVDFENKVIDILETIKQHQANCKPKLNSQKDQDIQTPPEINKKSTKIAENDDNNNKLLEEKHKRATRRSFNQVVNVSKCLPDTKHYNKKFKVTLAFPKEKDNFIQKKVPENNIEIELNSVNELRNLLNKISISGNQMEETLFPHFSKVYDIKFPKDPWQRNDSQKAKIFTKLLNRLRLVQVKPVELENKKLSKVGSGDEKESTSIKNRKKSSKKKTTGHISIVDMTEGLKKDIDKLLKDIDASTVENNPKRREQKSSSKVQSRDIKRPRKCSLVPFSKSRDSVELIEIQPYRIQKTTLRLEPRHTSCKQLVELYRKKEVSSICKGEKLPEQHEKKEKKTAVKNLNVKYSWTEVLKSIVTKHSNKKEKRRSSELMVKNELAIMKEEQSKLEMECVDSSKKELVKVMYVNDKPKKRKHPYCLETQYTVNFVFVGDHSDVLESSETPFRYTTLTDNDESCGDFIRTEKYVKPDPLYVNLGIYNKTECNFIPRKPDGLVEAKNLMQIIKNFEVYKAREMATEKLVKDDFRKSLLQYRPFKNCRKKRSKYVVRRRQKYVVRRLVIKEISLYHISSVTLLFISIYLVLCF